VPWEETEFGAGLGNYNISWSRERLNPVAAREPQLQWRERIVVAIPSESVGRFSNEQNGRARDEPSPTLKEQMSITALSAFLDVGGPE